MASTIFTYPVQLQRLPEIALLISSTVSRLPPFACTAKTVHDLTALPLSTTVQAPQLDVSQPTWVPVSPSTSLIKCTRSILGSASPTLLSPFTVSSKRTLASAG